MSYRREPLLKPEEEEQLKVEMSKWWDLELRGNQIAEILQFGEKNTLYEKVKPNYFYYYRQKFDLPIHKEPSFPKGSHRYKFLPEDIKKRYGIITPRQFVQLLDQSLPQDSAYARTARAFNIALYNTLLRSSELYERKITDFYWAPDYPYLRIDLLRKKKHKHKNDESFEIPRDETSPLIEELITYLNNQEWKKPLKNKRGQVLTNNGETLYNLRPWNICYNTARNYAKELGEEFYCHFFRFRWITDRASRPETTIAHLESTSHLTLDALKEYIVTDQDTARDLHKKTLEDMRRKGEI